MSSKASDVLEYINWQAVECLNESPQHSCDNALKQGYRDKEDLYLESDTDEQLILHINFNTALKLISLVIMGPDSGHGPKGVKLFMNRPTIGFSEASEENPTQELELTKENLKGESIALRVAKLQQVNTLSIFIESNQGDEDVTRVSKIVISGSSGESMNVSNIQKEEQR